MSRAPLVVITGISRGLGAAMARAFLERGYRVAGGARSAGALDRLAAEHGDGLHLRPLDVGDEASVARFAEELLAREGAPDLLLNNAGVIHRNAALWKLREDEVEEVLATNVGGVVRTIRHLLPAMVARGQGTVVNFSSGWGRSTSPEVAVYCASKWAVEGLTAALAQELPPGLSAVSFNPGIIDTEMLRSCFGDSAGHYPNPETWARTAVAYLSAIGPGDNGKVLTCPGF